MNKNKVLLDVNEGVAIITINNPDSRNALSEDVRSDFDLAIKKVELEAGKTIHAAILTGGGGSFCAGGDMNLLRASSEKPAAEMQKRLQASHLLMTRWFNLEIPTIAAVDGAAAGAGFSLALACDFVFATSRARFVLSFGRIGLIPDWGALYTLPRIVGLQKAKELAFSARVINTEEALELGIVYEIVDQENLITTATSFANRFRFASTTAIGITKNLLNKSFELDLNTSLDLEASGQAIANNSEYHHKAVKRFLDKEPSLFDWEKHKTV